MPCTQPSPRRLAEASVRRALSRCVGGALLLLAACGPDRTVEPAPTEAVPGPDLRAQAFKLTIDTRSGQVDVAPPARASASVDGLSLSLLGGDAIALSTGLCVFSAIPDRSRKRCTMDLSVSSRLRATDLVTPTTFPRPPQGTSGILVFPFTASTPAGEAVLPSPDWDLGPANFFNDNTCSGSEKTDCFRYELFPSPLYAGESTPKGQVGFDIPASASIVTAYLVVAADLRDNPVRTAPLSMVPVVPQLCGDIDYNADPPTVEVGDPYLSVLDNGLYKMVVFCTFRNGLPAGARVRSASVRLFGYSSGPILVQHVDWGTTLEPSDRDLPTLNSAGVLELEDPSYADADEKWYVAKDAKPGVQWAVDGQQAYIQFRIIRDPNASEGGALLSGAGAVSSHRPQLVVQYTLP